VVFDVQLASTASALIESLTEAGFEQPPVSGWARLEPLIAAEPDPSRLGHFGRDFAGQPQQIMLRRALPEGGVVLLRGWDSGLRLVPGEIPVWLIQVRELVPVRRFGFFNTWSEQERGRERALEQLQAALDWHWLQPEPGLPWLVYPARSVR